MTIAVAKDATATISASANGSKKTAALKVTAPTLKVFRLSASTVGGGQTVTGTVTLSSIAPLGGLVVSVTSSSANATVAPVTVAAGQTTATFSVVTKAVLAKTTAKITTTLGTASIGLTLTINPPTFTGLKTLPASVTAGTSANGVVQLSSAAPSAGVKVTLKSSQKCATVDASVLVPGGQTSVSFPIKTSYVSSATKATISGTALGATHSAVLTVNPSGALDNGPWSKPYANAQNTSSNSAPNAKGKLKWTVDFYGGVYSAVAYGKGQVAVVCSSQATNRLLIFGPDTALLHATDLGPGEMSAPAAGPDGSIYVTTASGLVGIRSTGAIKFHLALTNVLIRTPVVNSTGTIFTTGNGTLFAVNASGSLKWSVAGYGPSLLAGSGGAVYAQSSDGVAMLSSSGAVRWDRPTVIRSVVGAVGPQGELYLDEYDASDVQRQHLHVYALNLDGSVRYFWQGSALTNPVIGSDGVLYDVEGSALSGSLQAVSTTGQSLWHRDLPGPDYLTTANWSIAMRPDGAIVPANNTYVLAYTPAGTRSWVVEIPGHLALAPQVGSDGSAYLSAGMARFNGYGFIATGQVVRRISLAGALDKTFYGGGPSDAPAVGSDGTLYAPLVSGVLQTLHPDGSLGWSFVADSPLVSTPTIGADGTVYCLSLQGSLYAVNSAGVKKWSYQIGGPLRGGVALTNSGVLLVVGVNELVALDLNGRLKWTVKNTKAGPGGQTTAAIGLDGTIYYSAGDDGFRAVNPDGTVKWATADSSYGTPYIFPDGKIGVGAQGEALYSTDGKSLGDPYMRGSGPPAILSPAFVGSIYTGVNAASAIKEGSLGVTWNDVPDLLNPFGSMGGSATALGIVYVPGTTFFQNCYLNGGQLFAVNVATGVIVWSLPLIEGYTFATSIGADGTVYMARSGFLDAVG